MAGSRREKLGSILTRMTGLLRSGAIKEEDRPIWYDIVKALPPKPSLHPRQVQTVFYPEDYIRAHFYRNFTDSEPVTLNNNIISVTQRFVDKYIELQSQKSHPVDQLFQITVNKLQEEGVKLQTHEEKPMTNINKASADVPKVKLPTRNKDQQKMELNLDDLFKENT
ncbi:small ribosomal subunit protein mS23-like [Physella acuta]|uniref:small ribosomal subunit protein mS23-like n=1 Tax=Physella acuta TaxID=109671 RepID=UPI0027DBE5E2|nr:small ribosomal subunit protein mS23-like [Physella acuta]